MAFHPLMKLLTEGMDSPPKGSLVPSSEPPDLQDIFDKNQLREFIKVSPIEGDLYYAVISKNKEFMLETGGKNIKKLLHKREKGIQHQREVARALLESNREEAVTEMQSHNYLNYISVAITHQGQFLGSLIIGGFFIEDEINQEERFREWCRNTGFEYAEAEPILREVPCFSKPYLGKLKQYFLSLMQLLSSGIKQDRDEALASSFQQIPLQDVVEKYKHILNHSSDAIWVTDQELNVIFMNKAFRNLALRSNENQDTALQNVFDKKSQEEIQKKIKSPISSPKPSFTTRATILTGNNEPSNISVSIHAEIIYNSQGTMKGLFGVCKRPRHEIKQLELFSRASEQSPAIEIITDENHQIIYVNRQFTVATGYTYEDVAGIKSSMLADPEKKERLSEIETKIEQEHFWEGILKNRKKDGSTFWFNLRISAILDDSGAITNYIIVGKDITHQYRTESQFRNLLSNIPGMAYRCRNAPGWPMIFLSEEAERLTGYSAEELINHINFGDLIVDEDREYVWDEVQRRIESNSSFEITYRIETKNGKLKWVWERGRKGESQENEILLDGIISDISNLKNTELALRKSENRFRTLSMMAPVGIFTTNDEGYCEYANERLTEITGRTEEYLHGLHWIEGLHPEDKETVYEAWQKMLANHEPFKMKYRFIQPEGEVRWVLGEARPISTTSSQKVNFISTIIDITETIDYENRLKRQGDRYRSMFMSNSSVMLLVEPGTGKIIDANNAAIEFYGYPEQQFRNMTLADISEDESQEKMLSRMIEAYYDNRTYFQFKHRIADGTIRDVEVYSSTIELDNNNLFFSVVHDITDRLQAEQDLIAAKEKAEESDRLKSAFLATMSHELRTPLNSIIGFSDLMEEEKNPEEYRRFARQINNNGVRLLDIIEDVFEMSRIESERVPVKKARFSMLEMFKNLEEEALSLKKYHNRDTVEIRHSAETDNKEDILLYTDRSKLFQVFTNLIKNAIKFTKEGFVEIGNTFESGDIIFYVKDSGIGIPEEKQNMIFQRFRQVDDTNTRKYGGIGLGLSISKEITEKMGGKIWVDSQTGQGSTFYFSIPDIVDTRKQEYPQETDSPKTDHGDWKGVNILVAEDEESNQVLLHEILKRTGASIFIVNNGLELKDWMQKNGKPNIILMDIKMPEMDGLEATRYVKKHFDNMPVIAMTALVFDEEALKIKEAGCDEYLKKPVKAYELKQVAAKYIRKH